MRHVHVKEATGYKSTDIGMIPEDWDVYSLQDIVNQFVNGGTPSTKNEDFWSGNIPWVTGADILDQEVAVIRRYITAEAVDSSSTNVIPKGNLLIVSRTGVGKLAIAPCDIAISQDFTGIILRKEKILAEYLFRYLDFFQEVLVRQNQGTSIKGITRDTLTAILIAVPSYAEQRAIAEALSVVDGLIKSLEALIAKKKAIKQATMQQLLTGKTRLPGFSEVWETAKIGEVADIINGATPNTLTGAYWDGHIPWCTPTDITATTGKYFLATERSVTATGLDSCSAILLPVGALLLCTRATIGDIKIAALPVCTNQGFKSLVCKDNISNEFLYYLLLTLKSEMMARATGSTFLEISKHDVASIELLVPSYNEQSSIATVLSDMDTEIASLEQRLDKTRAIKQGMMQQLLTGRVRLFKQK